MYCVLSIVSGIPCCDKNAWAVEWFSWSDLTYLLKISTDKYLCVDITLYF